MPDLKAAVYVFLILIDHDTITFHGLHRAEGIRAFWVSCQGVYERRACHIRELMGKVTLPK